MSEHRHVKTKPDETSPEIHRVVAHIRNPQTRDQLADRLSFIAKIANDIGMQGGQIRRFSLARHALLYDTAIVTFHYVETRGHFEYPRKTDHPDSVNLSG